MLTYTGTTRTGRHRWVQDGYSRLMGAYIQGVAAYTIYLDEGEHHRLLGMSPSERDYATTYMAVTPGYRVRYYRVIR